MRNIMINLCNNKPEKFNTAPAIAGHAENMGLFTL
jgi:hypothetical protein